MQVFGYRAVKAKPFLVMTGMDRWPLTPDCSWWVQGGCGIAHLSWNHIITESLRLEKASKLSSLCWNTSMLTKPAAPGQRERWLRNHPETAHKRGTSATLKGRDGKASFEAKQGKVLLKFLFDRKNSDPGKFSVLSWLRKQTSVHRNKLHVGGAA